MKTVYVNGILLDGSEQMRPQTGMAIVTEKDKILSVEVQKASYDGMEIIDLKNQYIMPGLINLHVHLPSSGKPKKKQSDPKKLVRLMTSNSFLRRIMVNLCAGYANTQLLSGVTTIRTVGGVENVDTQIRDAILAGSLEGPRILAGNMAVSVPGGHMAGSLAYEATSPQQAREFVRKIAKDKPDLIKLMITGGVLDAKVEGEPGELKMSPEIIQAACEEAHALGLHVAAHVESPEGVRTALENGVDTIEHGAQPSAEIIQLFKDRGACQVATLSPALPFALFDRSVSHVSEMEQVNGKVVFNGIVECAKACLASGVPVGLGTDTGCPYITHYDMWREVNYFHQFCGVSNAFALYTATKRNAELVGLGAVTGSIEAGKCADFIITEKNPLDDLKALRNIRMVVARGRRIADPKVKKMPQVEQVLDQYI